MSEILVQCRRLEVSERAAEQTAYARADAEATAAHVALDLQACSAALQQVRRPDARVVRTCRGEMAGL